ncbi:MAG: leucine-rich repeat domain-containing protein [Holosporales bacterium]|jgi:hypothetical protein|nr:leucine-rich repeat domain-containing protein [Holosporales bacterium]
MKALLKLALLSASSVFSVIYACAAGGAVYAAALKPKLCISEGVAFDTIPITEIVDNAFKGDRSISSIVIPAGVKIIGKRAFFGCDGLQQVILQEGLKEVGEGAFYGCKRLQSINIPASVETINKGVFMNCNALETVKFAANSNLREIGSYAFDGCSKLQQIVIPASVQRIGRIGYERMTITLSKGSLSSLYDNGECSDATLHGLLRHIFPYYFTASSRLSATKILESEVILITPLGETIKCKCTGIETGDVHTIALQWQCSRNDAKPYVLPPCKYVHRDAFLEDFGSAIQCGG